MDRYLLANILYIELNLFALAIITVLLINIKVKKNRLFPDQRLFVAMVTCNALVLILDTVMMLIEGLAGQHIRVLLIIMTILHYSLNVLICALWYLYVFYYIFRDKELIKKRIVLFSFPFIVVLVLSIISAFKEVLFFIDKSNIYHRGKFFFILVGACVFYTVIAYICVIMKRKLLRNTEFRPMIFFAVPALIGGIIQLFVCNINFFLICTTLSLLIIYVNIQNSLLYKDFLTDLYNRRKYDNYIKTKINSGGNKKIAGIMIDIDSFKKINDEYGHDSGDIALKYTAQVLRETFSYKDFIARYGGDEFIVVLETESVQEPLAYINAINDNLEKLNASTHLPFLISLSIGYDFHTDGESTYDFFKR